MRTKYELADAIRLFGDALEQRYALTRVQMGVMEKIAQCRTAALGGHEEICDECSSVRYSYNSCGDRHCPKCQSSKQAIWIDELIQCTLPVKHYHIIFTVPHQLNVIALHNARMFYDLLFKAVWQTLRTFGYSKYGVESGAVAVLHTWGQNLSLHPHLHCIVPTAGYTLKGEWKMVGGNGRYLYPVQQLSMSFKARFLDSLKRSLRKAQELDLFKEKISQAYQTAWVVYCEPALAKAEHVVKYLGQYTHRVAITNQRIIHINKNKVTFLAKDYRDGGSKKPVTLDGVEFLRRFAMHILPRRFIKIRRYGIYNPSVKRNLALKFTVNDKNSVDGNINQSKSTESTLERIERLTGINPCECPFCKKGKMIRTRNLPRIRSPDTIFSNSSKIRQ